MSDFEITQFYNGREVITPTSFSTLVRGYPTYMSTLKTSKEGLPEVVVKRGNREYYYLDELLAWYEVLLQKKADDVARAAESFARVKELESLKRENNRASREALLNTVKS